MSKLYKENRVHIWTILVFWLVLGPVVYGNRHAILNQFGIWWGIPKSDPKLAFSLLEKSKNIAKNSKVDLKLMAKACDYYRKKSDEPSFTYEPTWYEKLTEWKDPDDPTAKGLQVPGTVHPQQYWSENINPVLESLDYAKRSQLYSGKNLDSAEWTEVLAKASCRHEEIFLAYSKYILTVESMLLDEVVQKIEGKKKKKKNLVLCI